MSIEDDNYLEEVLFKRDKTRLKTLLREYRDHIITVYWSKMQHQDIVTLIQEVDDAIKLIINNL